MKKTFKALNYIAAFSFILITLASCDKEFTSIDSDVLGEDNFTFNTTSIDFPVVTYNQNLEGQQINALSSNLLGVFNDPEYGQTLASIVAQVVPQTFTDSEDFFGENPQIESVILTIPYFSTQVNVDENGVSNFQLDSVYFDNNDFENPKAVTLKVYENTYFLRDFSVFENASQNYYSKADGSINNTDNFSVTADETINFDENVGTLFNSEAITPTPEARESTSTVDGVETSTFLPPALQMDLAESAEAKARWKNLILDQAGLSPLTNAGEFINHFKGLYIKADPSSDTSMMLLDLATGPNNSGANITINYSSDDGDDEGDERDEGAYVLNFSGNRLNTFINNYNPIFPDTPNTADGDDKLYLKGTEGGMGVVELFNGLVDCDGDGEINDSAFDCFKNTFRETDENGNFILENDRFKLKRLINEAHLVIYEDETLDNTVDPNENEFHAFDRLYIYNLENNLPIQDYFTDFTAEASNPFISRRFTLGNRIVDEQGNAKFKLKVTDLLNDILINDADNTKLGLVLTNNVNITSTTALLNSTEDVTNVPSNTVITPRGTIVYGNNTNATTIEGTSKKLRLEVFFTESE
jgi:hypothetical protein